MSWSLFMNMCIEAVLTYDNSAKIVIETSLVYSKVELRVIDMHSMSVTCDYEELGSRDGMTEF